MQIVNKKGENGMKKEVSDWVKNELASDNWTYLYNVLIMIKQFYEHHPSDKKL